MEKVRRVYVPRQLKDRPRTAEDSDPLDKRNGLNSTSFSAERPQTPENFSVYSTDELKGLSLDGVGQIEHNSHEYQMFLQPKKYSNSNSDVVEKVETQPNKLSQGCHHDQILQSYDVLFP